MRYIALAVGALLCGIGILHAIINVRSVTRAIARGEIVERMGAQLVANVVLAGLAFKILRGRGLDLDRAIIPYFLGQVILSPALLFERRMNLAMQTVVCRAL